MEKPFKTISEQIKILQSRGLVTDSLTSGVLEREGYYAVVNGYKEPFLDAWATGMAGDDRFKDGAKFSDLYELFQFDRALRSLFLRYSAMAEATLKAVCAYCFTQVHPDEINPYLNAAYYSREERYKRAVSSLIGDFRKALGLGDVTHYYKRSYLKHYVEHHGGEVPLWVLMNYLTFGQAFKFYSFQTQSMRNKVAKSFSALYLETHEEPKRISPESLGLAYDHIKDFRNICAHDERFYCSRVAKAQDITVRDLCCDFELVLTKEAHASLLREAYALVSDVESKISIPVDVAEAMGWELISQMVEECC